MNKVLLGTLVSLFSITAFADDIRLGNPSYSGNGCPKDSASASLSPDFKSLSLLFDSFVVSAGGASNKLFDRKKCDIAVPVHVPQGMTVSVFKIDYRGFNSLPFGAYSDFNVEYFFAGTRGPKFRKIFPGQTADNYLINTDIVGQAVIWSPCGQDVILRANTNMFVKTGPDMAEAMSTVDSADIKAGIQYHLAWSRC